MWQSLKKPENDTWRSGPRIRYALILFVVGVLFLTGCDYNYTFGIRSLSFSNPDEIPPAALVVLKNCTFCGPVYYYSVDSGFTWTMFSDAESQIPETSKRLRETDYSGCVQTCEFQDPITKGARYRITVGKTLSRSMDGGVSWEKEVTVPDWDQMTRNYLDMNQLIPKGAQISLVRGPFSALPDPGTGNLIVAMGLEGVLVRPKEGEWRWVKVGEFEHIKTPSLFVHGWTMKTFLSILYLILFIGLAVLVVSGIFSLWGEQKKEIIKILAASFSAMLIYWLWFILWSQGIGSDYGTAMIGGYFSVTVILGIILFYTSRVRRHSLIAEGGKSESPFPPDEENQNAQADR